MKRKLRNAGIVGRVAKNKPYLRLANENKILRWAKEHTHWTEELSRRPASQSHLFTIYVETFVGTI
jgi:hypothetical protein